MTSSDTTRATRVADAVTTVWPILSYRDAPAAMRFLADAFGFEPRAAYARDDDPTVIEHAEMRWPGGGGIMLGTAGKDDSAFGRRPPGNDSVYLVCDDPDALFERAVAAGAEVVRGLADEDYGSRGFTVRDPEGNLWSFGTYAGEPSNDAEDTIAGGTATDAAEHFDTLLAEWNEAIVANDADAIARFAEPDWVFVGENGIVPGDQFLDSVAKGRVTHDFMTAEVHDVRVYGDVAVVVVRVRNSGTFEGNPFQLDEWSTDVFIRRAGHWRCAVTHLTPVAAGTLPDEA
jgi:uncharacterized glyoxalase superfamily protein PhnB/ketosteroid isomerase-like protein